MVFVFLCLFLFLFYVLVVFVFLVFCSGSLCVFIVFSSEFVFLLAQIIYKLCFCITRAISVANLEQIIWYLNSILLRDQIFDFDPSPLNIFLPLDNLEFG